MEHPRLLDDAQVAPVADIVASRIGDALRILHYQIENHGLFSRAVAALARSCDNGYIDPADAALLAIIPNTFTRDRAARERCIVMPGIWNTHLNAFYGRHPESCIKAAIRYFRDFMRTAMRRLIGIDAPTLTLR